MMIDLKEDEVVLSTLIASEEGYVDIVRGKRHLVLTLDTINRSLLRFACMSPKDDERLRHVSSSGNIAQIGCIYLNTVRLVRVDNYAYLVGVVELMPDCKLSINDIIFRVSFTMIDFDGHISVLGWYAFDVFDDNFVPSVAI